jgi:hypothetical protein
MGIRWKRANDGFVISHCGKWKITPAYAGCARPQDYVLWCDGKVVSRMHATQREAKADAEYLASKSEVS